ncbi:MAG TPA: hypothetical protein VEA78_00790, partial [Acidimicrobiales bacterium]|nr:hypothetical protein [Acidimicrobiales bacterium]
MNRAARRAATKQARRKGLATITGTAVAASGLSALLAPVAHAEPDNPDEILVDEQYVIDAGGTLELALQAAFAAADDGDTDPGDVDRIEIDDDVVPDDPHPLEATLLVSEPLTFVGNGLELDGSAAGVDAAAGRIFYVKGAAG